MENIETLTLGEIVKKNYKTASVFEKFSLDFCCQGNRNINQACEAADVDPALVMAELRRAQQEVNDTVDFDAFTLHKLVDHILTRHHAYVEEKIPQIKNYLDRICRVHGGAHPELLEVRAIFFEIAGELTVHMKKEEIMLFPFIKRLENAKHSPAPVTSPLFKSVNFPVEMMKNDHALEGEKLARIAALTSNYTTPSDSCNTYAVSYQLLKEFEQDLHMHIHLENNILFPKAILLERNLNPANN